MPQVINTNILSLNAQRNLNTSGSSLATALQRLSTGLRINSAKDDAAGLAISERFTTQIRGLNQAVRNANDGISLAQTAEGALAEITNNLQRVRELAVQSANASNSSSDRAALDQEVQQRLAEIQRIAAQTSFNGQKILDGSFGSAAFQIGANVGETITLNLQTSMKTADIGSYASATSDVANVSAGTATASNGTLGSGAYQTGVGTYTGVSSASTDASVQINGKTVYDSDNYAVASDSYRAGDSAYAKAAAINASGIAGVTASASTVVTVDDNAVADNYFLDVTSLTGTDSMTYSLSVNGKAVFTTATIDTNGITMDTAVAAINTVSGDTGVVASKDSNNKLVLTAADGRNIKIDETFAFADGATVTDESDAVAESVFSTQTVTDENANSTGSGTISQALTYRGKVTLLSPDDIVINSGGAVLGFTSGSYAAASSLSLQNVLSVSAANNAISSADSALGAVSMLRSTFGAIQNRFESTIANLSTVAENLTSSRSRIQDADFAAETAALTRAQILQQAGTAILAQANSAPQNVLSLLR